MKSEAIINVRKTRIENIISLPTVPGNLKRISAIIEKPGLTLDELGRFVASDPALASKVLKMVNSAIYRRNCGRWDRGGGFYRKSYRASKDRDDGARR